MVHRRTKGLTECPPRRLGCLRPWRVRSLHRSRFQVNRLPLLGLPFPAMHRLLCQRQLGCPTPSAIRQRSESKSGRRQIPAIFCSLNPPRPSFPLVPPTEAPLTPPATPGMPPPPKPTPAIVPLAAEHQDFALLVPRETALDESRHARAGI